MTLGFSLTSCPSWACVSFFSSRACCIAFFSSVDTLQTCQRPQVNGIRCGLHDNTYATLWPATGTVRNGPVTEALNTRYRRKSTSHVSAYAGQCTNVEWRTPEGTSLGEHKT